MTRGRRARLASLALLVLAAPAVGVGAAAGVGASAPAAPAAASTPAAVGAPGTAGACTDHDGVTVMVDFAAFGGGLDVRCAGWPVSDGYDALRKAGFGFTDTTRFPGLLCRIEGLPGDQSCQNAPPSRDSWRYWHAERGGSWTFSSRGAPFREPKPGTVEGWAFGPGAQPRIAPPAPLPPPTTAPPTTAPAPPSTSAPLPSAPAASGPTPDPAAPAPTTAPAAGDETTGDEAGGDEAGGDEASADPQGPLDEEDDDARDGAEPDRDEREDAADRRSDAETGGSEVAAPVRSSAPAADPDSGSAVPAIATGAVVAALGAGGFLARRRRSLG